MKLIELRNWLREYELTWYTHKLTSGEHNAALYVRQYLKPFFDKSDDYQLSIADLYRLVTHIPLHSKLPLVCSIKNSLGANHFFDIYDTLDKLKLINPANFQVICELEFPGRDFLYRLFGHQSAEIEWAKLSAPILATILNIAMRLTAIDSSAIKCIRLLNKTNHLNLMTLRVLLTQEDTTSLLQLFKMFIRQRCLNEVTLECVSRLNSLSTVSMLLHLLEDTEQITINEDLIQRVSINQSKEYLLELVVILVNAKTFKLTPDLVSQLLQQQLEFFYYKIPLVRLFQQNDVLTNKIFQLVLEQDDLSLQRIFSILAERSLLNHNEQLIMLIMGHDKNRHLLYPVLSYLQQLKVLDQHVLISTVGQIMERNYQLYRHDIFDLYLLFQKNNLFLTITQYHQVSQLSKNGVQRVHLLVTNLISCKQLDSDSLAQVLHLVSARLPIVEQLKVVKISRKQSNLPRSELTINEGFSLFIEHGNHSGKGTYGVVKRAYNSAESHVATYGIKKLNTPNLSDAVDEAAREVKYHRLLGRQAFFFSRKGRACVIAEWQSEKAINLFSEHELMRTPLVQRLKCLSSGLSDLNILHARYRVHNDIKCQNFVLNLEQESMALIDFGSAHKCGSSNRFSYTPAFQDPARVGDGFSQDMYSMGFVVMYLFPELYTVIITPETKVKINKILFTLQEEAIINLVDSMMHANSTVSCTSRDAFNFCNQLIEQFDSLDEPGLRALIDSTLQHKELSVADILCDYLPKSSV